MSPASTYFLCALITVSKAVFSYSYPLDASLFFFIDKADIMAMRWFFIMRGIGQRWWRLWRLKFDDDCQKFIAPLS